MYLFITAVLSDTYVHTLYEESAYSRSINNEIWLQ